MKMRRVHYRYQRRPLCGIRASGQWSSRQITTTTSERDVTCGNCRRIIRQSFAVEGYFLYDRYGALLWESASGTSRHVREWAMKHFKAASWKVLLQRGYRVEHVLIQRI